MSMFPTANSTVYYNDAGEPLGWSDESSYEPDYDPYDDVFVGEDDEWACEACESDDCEHVTTSPLG